MNGYGRFQDPEAGHEDKTYFYLMKLKTKVSALFQYKAVRAYTVLVIVFTFLHLLHSIIPSDLNLNKEKETGGLLEISTYEPMYTSFQKFSTYETILQSKELVSKFNHRTTIRPVYHPTDVDMTLEAIRFKKELKVLKNEMWKTLNEYQFTCVGSIALGVPYNVFMDKRGSLYVNIEVFEVPNPTINRTVSISGIFDSIGEEHDETLFQQVRVNYVETNRFRFVENQTIADLDAYCLQSYLNNFPFKHQEKRTTEEDRSREL